MNWTDEPATWKQLKYLKQCGCQPERRLTKAEASDLIKSLGGPSLEVAVSERHDPPLQAARGPHHFRLAVENARLAVEQADNTAISDCRHKLDSAIAQRQRFWADTFCGGTQMRADSIHIVELYRLHGCLFAAPTHKQIQEILDALDSALPVWDRDHPALFYETLRINFPMLLRRT